MMVVHFGGRRCRCFADDCGGLVSGWCWWFCGRLVALLEALLIGVRGLDEAGDLGGQLADVFGVFGAGAVVFGGVFARRFRHGGYCGRGNLRLRCLRYDGAMKERLFHFEGKFSFTTQWFIKQKNLSALKELLVTKTGKKTLR